MTSIERLFGGTIVFSGSMWGTGGLEAVVTIHMGTTHLRCARRVGGKDSGFDSHPQGTGFEP